MVGYDDKRNFYRMMINSPCEMKLLGDPAQRTFQAICKDISATGMSLEADQPAIDIGALIEVSIESSGDQIPSLLAKAKVIRCDQQSDNACLIGVEISEMT